MKCSYKKCRNNACGTTSLNLHYCKNHQENILDIVKQTTSYIRENEKSYKKSPMNMFLED